MQITIAVVQFAIAQFEPDTNLARMERFLQEAVARQADLVIFPEDAVLGPLNGRADLADFEQRYARAFQQLAARYHVDLVPGSFIEGEESGLYNTTCYIDHHGEILGRYRKVHLWLPERSYLDPGRETVVCQTRFGRVGLAICWDLAFPEHFRALLAREAELVLCPSYWCYEDAGPGLGYNPQAEILFVDALCTARAFEQEIILVYANAAGELDLDGAHATLIGHSQITVPFQGALSRCEHNRETLIVQTVETDLLAKAEVAYEIRQDLRKGLLLPPLSSEGQSPM